MPELPLISRARSHGDRTALTAGDGMFSYADLLLASERVAGSLTEGADDLRERRVAFLVPPSFQYAAIQWGVWCAGGIAVPLAVSHPSPELHYVVQDSQTDIVVAHPELAPKVRPFLDRSRVRFLSSPEALAGPRPTALPALDTSRRALMVYTSGTTGKPKGVVTTHANIEAQVTTLVEAWGWTRDDHTLLVLPLHHVHGIINVLTCALWTGAICDMMPRFDANGTWHRIASGDLTVFMAVPTIYRHLITAWDAASPADRAARSQGCRQMRLMVSGSAALPLSTGQRWTEISGHTLLERYGMTEIGMALSHPLRGVREPGLVGSPLPRVDVRLVDEHGAVIRSDDTPGEIEVRGPGVFLEYWHRPKATRDAFHDGWFRTGDVAVVQDGQYRILGRLSVDIVKTGGYKVSALEIEDVLRTHPDIAECAVIGVADDEWGERLCVAVELEPNRELELDSLQAWARDRLAPYKVPRDLWCLRALPRNAMGKVTKADLKRLFERQREDRS